MARADLDVPLQPSVLDRLIDEDPERTSDPPKSRGQSLAELRAAVRRELEAILNTRYRCRSWPRDLAELDRSLLNYGIPDFTSAFMATDASREWFREAIEQAIRRCEPRFQRVDVQIMENTDQLDRMIRFRIEALIYADPAPEPIVFDSMVEPSTHSISIAGSGNG